MTLPSTHIKKFNFCYAFHSLSPGILKENSYFSLEQDRKKKFIVIQQYMLDPTTLLDFSVVRTKYLPIFSWQNYQKKKKTLEWNKSRHSRAKKTVSFILISEMKPDSWLYAVGNNLAASNVNYEQPCLPKAHSGNQSSAFRCYGRKNSF